MVKPDERSRDVTGHELYGYIAYMRASYNIEIEMHLSIQEAGKCAPEASITGVGGCYGCSSMRVFTWKCKELSWAETAKVLDVFLDLMMELQEEVDDTKQLCTECQVLDYPF